MGDSAEYFHFKFSINALIVSMLWGLWISNAVKFSIVGDGVSRNLGVSKVVVASKTNCLAGVGDDFWGGKNGICFLLSWNGCKSWSRWWLSWIRCGSERLRNFCEWLRIWVSWKMWGCRWTFETWEESHLGKLLVQEMNWLIKMHRTLVIC